MPYNKNMKAIILVTQGLEECEALLTYDLLYRAGIEVDLVSDSDMVTSSRNVTFKPHRLLKDIDPDEYDCLILDEVHERTLNIDFLLGYVRKLLRKRRPALVRKRHVLPHALVRTF